MPFGIPAQSILLETPKFASTILNLGQGYSIATRYAPLGIPFWVWLTIIGCLAVRPLVKKFRKFPIETKEDDRISGINSFYVVTVFVLLGLSFLEYATTNFAREYAIFYGLMLVIGMGLILYLKSILSWFGFNVSFDNKVFNIFPIKPEQATGLLVLSIPALLLLTSFSNGINKPEAQFQTVGLTFQSGNIENKLLSAFVAPVEDLVLIRLSGLAISLVLMTILSTLIIKIASLKPAKSMIKNPIALYNQKNTWMAYIAVFAIVMSMTFNAEVVAPNFHEVNYGNLAPIIAETYGYTEEEALTVMKQQVADFWFWSTGVSNVAGNIIAVDALHAFNNYVVS